MKRIFLTLLALVALMDGLAQMRTAYFMQGSYFRTELNPALTPARGYVALPALGGVGVGLSNNMLSVNNLFYNRDGQTVTALHSSVTADEFLKRLPENGSIFTSNTVNVLGVGFATKKAYYNFGINARLTAELFTNKDLFRALKELGGNTYDLSAVGLDCSTYAEVYFGASAKVNDWLRIGVKLKGLVGVMNVNGSLSEGSISFTNKEVTGMLRGQLRGSGVLINPEYPLGVVESLNDILCKPNFKNLNNVGAALDFGLSASLLDDKLRVSAAVTDLGFISWNAKSAAVNVGVDFAYRGINVDSVDNSPVDSDYATDITAVESSGYLRRLNTTVNVGAEYAVLDDKISFGLLCHTEFRRYKILSELTASVNFRAGRVFSFSVSHTFCGRNRPGVLGWALNLHPAGVNLFVGMDFIDTSYVKYNKIPLPKFQKSLNCYFGLGFNFGKWRPAL